VAQVLGYLSLEECDAFQAYAGELRLDRSALANLLIVRELRAQRLAVLKMIFDRDLPKDGKAKITAHQGDTSTKDAFIAHAKGQGIKPTRAAAILFRAELTERWLEASMDITPI
jgi:hypothetical protein